MNDNPRLNPSDPSPNSTRTALNPVLVKALASLEVQLDQELARYRRNRTGSRTPNPPRIVNSITSQSLGLHLSPSVNPSPPSAISGITTDTPVKTPTSNVITEASEENQSTATTKIPQPSPSTSIVPTRVQSNGDVNLPDTTHHSPEPDDYLESSEALLRSLTEEQEQKTSQEKNKNTSDGLLSPLGIGSMLLLLLASLTLGYVLFNPKSLPKFSLNGLFQRQPSSTAGNTEVGESNPNQPQTPASPIPKYPNLATEEFPEVNNPNDIVGLTPKPKLTPINPPTPVTPPVAVTPVQPLVTPTPTPTPTVNPTPTPTPEVSQVPLTDIKPSADGFYHVVTDNQGGNALTKARGTVGDAYLSDDGKIIYLGAVKTKSKAEELLKQLKAKGINARIKQP